MQESQQRHTSLQGKFPAPISEIIHHGYHSYYLAPMIQQRDRKQIQSNPQDGSVPDPSNGKAFIEPVSISSTAIVRAAAFKDDFAPTNIDTHSYIFPQSTLKQPNVGPGLPRSWAGKPADYEMDPEIVNDPNYSDKIITALEAFPSLSIAIKQEDFYGSKGLYQNPKSQGDGWERSVSVEFIPNNENEDEFQIDSGMRIQGGSSRNPDIPKHSFSLRFRKEYGNAKLRHPLFRNSPYGISAVEEFDYLQLRGGSSSIEMFGSIISTGELLKSQFASSKMSAPFAPVQTISAINEDLNKPNAEINIIVGFKNFIYSGSALYS